MITKFVSYAELKKQGAVSACLNMTPEQIESVRQFLKFSIQQTRELMANSENDLNWIKMELLVGRAELMLLKLDSKRQNVNVDNQ